MSHTFKGEVVSAKTNKTIVVAVKTRKSHPLYNKLYVSTNRFMAHDEKQIAKEGDLVIINETRPISKKKRWVLVKVVEKAHIRHVERDNPEEEKA